MKTTAKTRAPRASSYHVHGRPDVSGTMPSRGSRPAQLGRALTILLRHRLRECAMHDDVRAHHAPSECHALVARGGDRWVYRHYGLVPY